MIDLKVLAEFELASSPKQLRAVPVEIGDNQKALLLIYCGNGEIDPSPNMFFFPRDTLKMRLVTLAGKTLWERDLGPAILPGLWFCPVFPFDLDSNGIDEIWYVNHSDPDHPLDERKFVLEAADPRTGKILSQSPWPHKTPDQPMYQCYRHFILGGFVHGKPVLVTAQGTYSSMFLQGWNPALTPRWEHGIQQQAPGARGSHMCPVVDINHDNVDEVLWGERCIELDTGRELFCADRDSYRGHSDIVQPVRNHSTSQWSIYTCRETHPAVSPRVVLYDHTGNRLWGAIDAGHIDMGWVARIGDRGQPLAMAIRIAAKSAGPAGVQRQNIEEFGFDFHSGQPHTLPFTAYRTIPVDLNGDGLHELVRGLNGGDGSICNPQGLLLGNVGGPVAMACHFCNLPGEQIVSWNESGLIRIWADANASDSQANRFAHPAYLLNRRLSACGYNLTALAGI